MIHDYSSPAQCCFVENFSCALLYDKKITGEIGTLNP